MTWRKPFFMFFIFTTNIIFFIETSFTMKLGFKRSWKEVLFLKVIIGYRFQLPLTLVWKYAYSWTKEWITTTEVVCILHSHFFKKKISFFSILMYIIINCNRLCVFTWCRAFMDWNKNKIGVRCVDQWYHFLVKIS